MEAVAVRRPPQWLCAATASSLLSLLYAGCGNVVSFILMSYDAPHPCPCGKTKENASSVRPLKSHTLEALFIIYTGDSVLY